MLHCAIMSGITMNHGDTHVAEDEFCEEDASV